MIRIKDIQEKFLHLVGWEQNYYNNLKISDDLTVSESGLYFQHVHPLLTLQNISCIAPDFKNFKEKYITVLRCVHCYFIKKHCIFYDLLI